MCSWCGRENCSKKCSVKNCVNCGKNHSAFYKGCEVYKKLFDKALITRNDKQKLQKINIISESLSQCKTTCQSFEKSYAQVVNFEKKSESLESKVDNCLTYVKKVENGLTDINTNLNKIVESVKTQNTRLSKVENNINLLKKDISSLSPKIKSLEEKSNSLSSSISEIKESFVSKAELSEELSEELKSFSEKHVDHNSLILILFECLYAIEQGHMSDFMSICFHLLSISSRHLGPIDKSGFTNRFTALQETSLIVSQNPPDANSSLP